VRLTIIPTSYDRPRFVTRAIESVLNQTNPNWRLIIQDDGSGQGTLGKIRPYADSDHRITLHEHTVTNRREVTRYAVLINEAMPWVDSELVGYMCDNVEYKPEMVDSVLEYFAANPNAGAGYVYHQRDWYDTSGKRRGRASDLGHWDFTPPVVRDIHEPMGMLDHSQVFHRLPIAARWDEDMAAVKCGDGLFFQKLVLERGAIRPIRPGKVLSVEHLFQ